MCLGIPARITGISDAQARLARADLQGRVVDIHIGAIVAPGQSVHDCVGCWVLVHQGFATSRVDEREAQLTLSLLQELAAAQAHLRASGG
jgi:hydrogenase expression/formation protein HypC